MTYPSTYEGFGNALLEAIYFRVPVVINRYSIYVQDIEPKGQTAGEMALSPRTWSRMCAGC